MIDRTLGRFAVTRRGRPVIPIFDARLGSAALCLAIGFSGCTVGTAVDLGRGACTAITEGDVPVLAGEAAGVFAVGETESAGVAADLAPRARAGGGVPVFGGEAAGVFAIGVTGGAGVDGTVGGMVVAALLGSVAAGCGVAVGSDACGEGATGCEREALFGSFFAAGVLGVDVGLDDGGTRVACISGVAA